MLDKTFGNVIPVKLLFGLQGRRCQIFVNSHVDARSQTHPRMPNFNVDTPSKHPNREYPGKRPFPT